MDKNQITNLVVNAVLTIVTTAIVTRLSLNKGTLGITSKLKARLTPKAVAYIKLLLTLLAVTWLSYSLYNFVETPNQTFATREDVLYIAINTVVIMVGCGHLIYTVVEISMLTQGPQAEPPEKD